MSDAISYTAATGKRPCKWTADDGTDVYEWAYPESDSDFIGGPLPEACLLHEDVYDRLEPWDRDADGVFAHAHMFPTEAAALAAADAAYLKAVADGAMGPIGEGVAP